MKGVLEGGLEKRDICREEDYVDGSVAMSAIEAKKGKGNYTVFASS